MNINQHNYEAFFIQYLDKELSATEQLAVESFILDHPSLAEEMEMLQQLRLVPDEELIYHGKEMLLKDASSITENNYVEYFLSYTDNELSPVEEKQLHAFIALHPHKQKELDLLLLTRMQPEESVAFASKESFYRYEKEEKIFRLSPWKITIAAALLISFGAGTFMLFNYNSTSGHLPVATITKTMQKENKTKENQKNSLPLNESVEKDKTPPPTFSRQEPREYASGKMVPENKNVNTEKGKDETGKLSEKTLAASKSINLPVAIKDLTPNGNAINVLPQHTINESAVTYEGGGALDLKAMEPVATNYTAVNEEPNNKKIRGFFRKATRILERTTNITATNEDDKLLVGGFAINLK